MHRAEVVSIVFILINFGVLIGLGIFLFKKYVLSSITLQISKRQQKLADLALQTQLLKEQAKRMDFTIAEQSLVSHGLLQKIDLWKTLVSQSMLEREQKKVERELVLVQKMKTQQLYIELHYAQKKALLPAIEKAKEVLVNHYKAMPLGQSFIIEIVKHMEKS